MILKKKKINVLKRKVNLGVKERVNQDIKVNYTICN